MYLVSVLKSGLTVSTVNTYASELSVLAKFLYEDRIQIEDIDDDVLIRFSDHLVYGIRSGNHINRLILRSLKYLIWYGQIFSVDNFIGKVGDGCRISIEYDHVGAKRGALATRARHISMVPASTARTVRPLSYQDVIKLATACRTASSSSFKITRDRCLVTLLADSGIRREEATWIQCCEVKDAICNAGRLRIRTSKRRGNPLREVPIPDSTLDMLERFIDVQRAIHMRNIKGRRPDFVDMGWLFCGYGGRKLAPTSLTHIFSMLRQHASIQGRATPHMLRHRYITLQIIARLNSLQHSSVGLEMLSTILSQVASLSGHSSIESLWTYVDWAFDEFDAFRSASDFDYLKAISVLEGLETSFTGPDAKNVSDALTSCIALLKRQSTGRPRLNAVSHSLRK